MARERIDVTPTHVEIVTAERQCRITGCEEWPDHCPLAV